jgi:hypothetical protein
MMGGIEENLDMSDNVCQCDSTMNKTKKLDIRISPSLLLALKKLHKQRLAKNPDVSFPDVVREIIRKGLAA